MANAISHNEWGNKLEDKDRRVLNEIELFKKILKETIKEELCENTLLIMKEIENNRVKIYNISTDNKNVQILPVNGNSPSEVIIMIKAAND